MPTVNLFVILFEGKRFLTPCETVVKGREENSSSFGPGAAAIMTEPRG
jgi:hypothetical protein